MTLFSFFFSGRKYFSRPLFSKISRAFWSFLGHNLRIFLGLNIIFSGRYSGIFCIFTGKILHFFSRAPSFYSRVEFCKLFLGTFFSSRAGFEIFSRAVSKRQKIVKFLGTIFFLGKKKHWFTWWEKKTRKKLLPWLFEFLESFQENLQKKPLSPKNLCGLWVSSSKNEADMIGSFVLFIFGLKHTAFVVIF